MKEHVWPLVRPRLGTIAAVTVAVLLSTAATIAGPVLIKYAIDNGLSDRDENALEQVALAFVAPALVKPLLQRFIVIHTARAGEGFLADLRTATYNRLQELSLPYFEVADLGQALERVEELGGSVIHPGERWAVCRDSEGSPFGLALGR